MLLGIIGSNSFLLSLLDDFAGHVFFFQSGLFKFVFTFYSFVLHKFIFIIITHKCKTVIAIFYQIYQCTINSYTWIVLIMFIFLLLSFKVIDLYPALKYLFSKILVVVRAGLATKSNTFFHESLVYILSIISKIFV